MGRMYAFKTLIHNADDTLSKTLSSRLRSTRYDGIVASVALQPISGYVLKEG